MPRKNSSPKASAAEVPQDDSKEAKKQRRLIRNRLSAQMHRERQRAYMSGLQNQVAALSAERDLWRQAFDSVAARHSSSAGVDLTSMLAGIALPLPAEQVAPAPPPATGQAARGADGADVMADLMDRARTTILPRGRAAEADAIARTQARIVKTMAEDHSDAVAAEAHARGRGHTGRRRAPKRRVDADESYDTEATAGRASAAGSADTDWADGGSPAKRAATDLSGPPSLVAPQTVPRQSSLESDLLGICDDDLNFATSQPGPAAAGLAQPGLTEAPGFGAEEASLSDIAVPLGIMTGQGAPVHSHGPQMDDLDDLDPDFPLPAHGDIDGLQGMVHEQVELIPGIETE